jgi:hypothetical protein
MPTDTTPRYCVTVNQPGYLPDESYHDLTYPQARDIAREITGQAAYDATIHAEEEPDEAERYPSAGEILRATADAFPHPRDVTHPVDAYVPFDIYVCHVFPQPETDR